MARTSAVAALRDRLAEVAAERDRLRDAIEAILRHERQGSSGPWYHLCKQCTVRWPCPTERAHRLLAHDAPTAEVEP